MNPFSASQFIRYHQMGKASLLLDREQEGIGFLERAVAMNPNDGWAHRWLAVAYALVGRIEDAKRSLAKADALWPYDTVRGFGPGGGSDVFRVQTAHFREALKLAGERDHAIEVADFGIPADSVLHSEAAGHTPMAAPGVTTIRTAELDRMASETQPMIIDAAAASLDQSIPGAVGLKFAGLGVSFSDVAHARLGSKMRDLTSGDLDKPIVTNGLELGALRWAQSGAASCRARIQAVYWYRGGREAWEVAGQPEAVLTVQDW